MGLSFMAFLMFRYVPSVFTLLKVLNYKCMLHFVRNFFCICLDDHIVFLILQFVIVMYHINSTDVESFLHPGINSALHGI